jgi:periplasmic protein TonB
VFRIDAQTEEARSEPLLLLRPELAPPRLSPVPAAGFTAADKPEPVRLRGPLPGSEEPEDGEQPIASQQRRWRFGPVASLILHLLPLLLLLSWPMHPPAEITPIPVQLVFQPPPPAPKPLPKPKLKPETRPPPGRIASADLGDTKVRGHDQSKTDEPTPDKEPAAPFESPLEAPQKTAFLPPPPPLPDPPKLEFPKPPEPKPVAAPKPPQKTSLAARLPVRPIPQRAHLLPRWAKYPGPAATRDEYLAYLAYLARQHIGLLSPSLIGGRRGETIVNVLVLDDGTVAMLSIGLSSGYPEIDARVEQMIRAVGRFPPLPQWYQAPSMRLEFRLQFPEALED